MIKKDWAVAAVLSTALACVTHELLKDDGYNHWVGKPLDDIQVKTTHSENEKSLLGRMEKQEEAVFDDLEQ